MKGVKILMRKQGRWKKTLAAVSAFAAVASMVPSTAYTAFADEASQEAVYSENDLAEADIINEEDTEENIPEEEVLKEDSAEDITYESITNENNNTEITAEVNNISENDLDRVETSSSVSAAPLAAEAKAGTPYNADGAYDVTVPHVVVNQVYGGSDPDCRRSTYYFNNNYHTYRIYNYYLSSAVKNARPSTTTAITRFGQTGKLSDMARWNGAIAWCSYYNINQSLPVPNGHQSRSESIIPMGYVDGSVKTVRCNFATARSITWGSDYSYYFYAISAYFGSAAR